MRNVTQQSFLGLHSFLQLAGHCIEIPGQFIGFIAAATAYLQPGVQVARSQAARCHL